MTITIYTGDTDTTADKILDRAQNTFNVIVARKNLNFTFLSLRKWLEAECYPYFTLLGQSFGSIVLGLEVAFKHQPGNLFGNIVLVDLLNTILFRCFH